MNHFIVASSLLFASLSGSDAFSCKPHNNEYRRKTSLNAESSSALHYRQGNDNSFAPSTILYAANGAIEETAVKSEGDIELRIEAALQNARDMDRRYGLCTQPSLRAWEIVDELYMQSAASQKVEASVKSVLGTEKSVWSLYE